MIIDNRAKIDRLLIHECTLHRVIRKKQGAGNYITSWSAIKENMKCRFSIYSPKDLKTAEEQRRSFPASHLVFTRGDEEVREGDRLIFLGKTYEVVSPPQDPSFVGHHLEIEVRLLTKEELKTS